MRDLLHCGLLFLILALMVGTYERKLSPSLFLYTWHLCTKFSISKTKLRTHMFQPPKCASRWIIHDEPKNSFAKKCWSVRLTIVPSNWCPSEPDSPPVDTRLGGRYTILNRPHNVPVFQMIISCGFSEVLDVSVDPNLKCVPRHIRFRLDSPRVLEPCSILPEEEIRNIKFFWIGKKIWRLL